MLNVSALWLGWFDEKSHLTSINCKNTPRRESISCDFTMEMNSTEQKLLGNVVKETLTRHG